MSPEQEHNHVTPEAQSTAAFVGAETMLLAGVEQVPTEIESISAEQSELRKMMEASEVLGQYELIEVGDAGYVIDLKKTPAIVGNDWVMFDQDDTLIAYSGAKSVRQQNFEQYAESTGLDISQEQSKTLLAITDSFSRWQGGEAVMYHLDAHKLALGWATSVLRNSTPEEVDATIQSVKHELDLITAHANQATDSPESDAPFHFDNEKLVSDFMDYDDNLDSVFDAMVEPPSYDDVLDSLRALAGNEDPDTQVNVGIYTYGEPSFQLKKIIKLMEAQAKLGKDLPVSQIWLTKASKGVFIDELVRTISSEPSQSGHADTLREELFDPTPHVIMLVDDSPKELDGFSGSNQAIFAATGTRLARMRLIKSDTKAESSNWGLSGHQLHLNTGVGLYDARSEESGSLNATIYKYLTSNLSWAVSKRFETSTLPEPTVAQRLNKRVEFYAKNAEGADFAGGMLKVKLDDGSEQDSKSFKIAV